VDELGGLVPGAVVRAAKTVDAADIALALSRSSGADPACEALLPAVAARHATLDGVVVIVRVGDGKGG
jgi:hypothetical protein